MKKALKRWKGNRGILSQACDEFGYSGNRCTRREDARSDMGMHLRGAPRKTTKARRLAEA